MSIRSLVARAAAVVAVAATVSAASAVQAQQTTPTDSGQHKGAQHKMASKSRASNAAAPSRAASSQAAAASTAISADSAKAIALANNSGATVKSATLSRKGGHAMYRVRLAGAQGQPDTWATVDATTGAYAKVEHTTARAHGSSGAHKAAAKKSSGK